MSDFVTKCLRGEALLDEVDDYIGRWHDGDSRESLATYLGMTDFEYGIFLTNPGALPLIVTAHKYSKDVRELLKHKETLPMAARASWDFDDRQFEEWLRQEGLW